MSTSEKKKLNKEQRSTAQAVRMDPDTILEVSGLTKVYTMGSSKVTALNNINLTVKKGEFIAIVGPSGSGKTTTINCLGALDFPDAGKIIYNVDGKGMGLDITQMTNKQHKKMRLKKIGLIFQFYNLFPILTAYENVELPMLLAKKDQKERKEKVQSLLKRVGLDKRMEHRPTQMSGGEQQRLTIARSLVNEPLIILADEPTGELDTDTTTNIMKIFLELKEAGQSILMVTHNTRIAEVADKILTLVDGQITDERKGGKPLEGIYKT
ncbi:MAG: ABC transporter ATP-binding protein [Candidatus Lokiarchaeota archaeon]|nr:ABC transporter ATP-binding protein [Candidatus Lokiarchaeota archaeon]